MSELNAIEQRIVDAVETHGWFALSVAPREDSDDPQEWFTYTIGLPKSKGWPEIICFGLSSEVAHGILFDAITECTNRALFPSSGIELTETLNGAVAKLVDGSQIADSYFGSAIWFARYAGTKCPPDRVQLIWPDKDGKFPNDPDCVQEVRDWQTPLETT